MLFPQEERHTDTGLEADSAVSGDIDDEMEWQSVETPEQVRVQYNSKAYPYVEYSGRLLCVRMSKTESTYLYFWGSTPLWQLHLDHT